MIGLYFGQSIGHTFDVISGDIAKKLSAIFIEEELVETVIGLKFQHPNLMRHSSLRRDFEVR